MVQFSSLDFNMRNILSPSFSIRSNPVPWLIAKWFSHMWHYWFKIHIKKQGWAFFFLLLHLSLSSCSMPYLFLSFTASFASTTKVGKTSSVSLWDFKFILIMSAPIWSSHDQSCSAVKSRQTNSTGLQDLCLCNVQWRILCKLYWPSVEEYAQIKVKNHYNAKPLLKIGLALVQVLASLAMLRNEGTQTERWRQDGIMVAQMNRATTGHRSGHVLQTCISKTAREAMGGRSVTAQWGDMDFQSMGKNTETGLRDEFSMVWKGGWWMIIASLDLEMRD